MSTHPATMVPVRRLLVLCLLALGPVALLGAAPALAHGDDGTLEVLDAVPTPAGDAVTYTVELTYANDGDPVEGADVSATVRAPGADPRPPITLASIGEGWYAGSVAFPGPGRWTVAFAAVEPAAAVEATYVVPATPTPTPTPTTVAPAPTTTAPQVDATLADDESDLDEGPPAGLIVGVVFAGAALVAVVVILILRRRPLD